MGRLEGSPPTAGVIFPVWLQALTGLELAAVIVAAFAWLPAAAGFPAPEASRIVVFHVPCAIIAVVAYVVSMVYAIGHLWRRTPSSDVKSAASASIGFLFTMLATVTGMIFAEVQWGTAWNWDPRETSILMLLVIYAAYFALRSSLPAAVRGRISAGYNILAAIAMPYFVFVLPRLTAGLHPTTTLTTREGLSPEYRLLMLAAMAGYVLLYIWMLRLSVRVSELQAARRRTGSRRAMGEQHV